jgi:hypothetical protein
MERGESKSRRVAIPRPKLEGERVNRLIIYTGGKNAK